MKKKNMSEAFILKICKFSAQTYPPLLSGKLFTIKYVPSCPVVNSAMLCKHIKWTCLEPKKAKTYGKAFTGESAR